MQLPTETALQVQKSLGGKNNPQCTEIYGLIVLKFVFKTVLTSQNQMVLKP